MFLSIIVIVIIIIIVIIPSILYFYIKLSSFLYLGSRAERKILLCRFIAFAQAVQVCPSIH